MWRLWCIVMATLLCLPFSVGAEGELLEIDWVEETGGEVIELDLAEWAAEPQRAPLYAALALDQSYAMAGQRAMSWQVSAWGGKAPFHIRTWVTLEDTAVFAAEESLSGDGALSFAYMPERFGIHTIHAEILDAAGGVIVKEASLPVSVNEYETESTWMKSMQSVALTGDWSRDLLAVVRSQLGYAESTRNFIIDQNGVLRGYTRYGDWYGAAYANWCAMFVSFCLHYAGIPGDRVPYEASCAAWIGKFDDLGVYHKEAYRPRPGDLAFLNFDGNHHVGIVTDVWDDAFSTIEGNAGGAVASHAYRLADSAVMGFASLHALLDRPTEATMNVQQGDVVTFTARRAGTAYQWQYNDGSGWKDLAESPTWRGVRSDTLRFIASAARANWQYRVVVTDGQGQHISKEMAFSLDAATP